MVVKNNSCKYTYVTLLSSDDFLVGVVMLSLSLKAVGAKYPLLTLCSGKLSTLSLMTLKKYSIEYRLLQENIIIDTTKINTAEGYDHWNRTFDKLFVWKMIDFKKVVYLDSDMQVVRNIDYLFDYPHMSAVIADQWNEPGLDKLNSGLMVIEPNLKEFEGLREIWESGMIKLKKVGDQDIIRAYYKDWGKQGRSLQSGLNVFYSEISAGIIKKEDIEPVSVIHYIGARKPWMVSVFALLRRMRRNFLWQYLFLYSVRLYFHFPKCILPQKCR